MIQGIIYMNTQAPEQPKTVEGSQRVEETAAAARLATGQAKADANAERVEAENLKKILEDARLAEQQRKEAEMQTEATKDKIQAANTGGEVKP